MDSMFTKMGAVFWALYVLFGAAAGAAISGILYLLVTNSVITIGFSLWLPVLICAGLGFLVGLGWFLLVRVMSNDF